MKTHIDSHGSSKRVAMLMTDGVEQSEYVGPRLFLEDNGIEVTLVSPKSLGDEIQCVNRSVPGDRFLVEMNIRQANPESFAALVIPGGVANPDRLRLSAETINFIKDFSELERPIAAICHGPWPLIDAGILNGKHVTSWPSLQQDLQNAGAVWSDEAVVVDGNLVTSRMPEDIQVFSKTLLDKLNE